jgi:hypothetical protein
MNRSVSQAPQISTEVARIAANAAIHAARTSASRAASKVAVPGVVRKCRPQAVIATSRQFGSNRSEASQRTNASGDGTFWSNENGPALNLRSLRM